MISLEKSLAIESAIIRIFETSRMGSYPPGKPVPYIPPPEPKGFAEKLKILHLNYNMFTSLYMLEPMERTIINCIMILIAVMMLYSTCMYLPHYIWKLLVLAVRLLTAPEGSQLLVEDVEAVIIGKSEL